ncbi:Uncharacterised protein [Serratia marcescens]|nr:Uncharacterised protein [Serratia marcescens]
MIKPTATTCIATSFGMPNMLHASGISDQQQRTAGHAGGAAGAEGRHHAQQQGGRDVHRDAQRVYRRQRQHGDGDRRAGHVDGGAQRDGNRVGVLIQVQLLAQFHVHRDVGGGAAGEEGGHAALAQAGEHQRIRVAADLPVNDQRVEHQRHQQHAAKQHHQQLGVAPQRAEAGFRQRGGHQAEDAERRTADHRAHHQRDRMGHVVDQPLGGLGSVAQRQPQTDGPGQNADVVGVNQRMERVGHHAHQQALHHLHNAARRGNVRRAGGQRQRGREDKADDHRHQRGGKGAQQVEEQDRANVGLLPLFMVGDRGHDQNQHQHRRHRFQRADEQGAEQADRRCRRR